MTSLSALGWMTLIDANSYEVNGIVLGGLLTRVELRQKRSSPRVSRRGPLYTPERDFHQKYFKFENADSRVGQVEVPASDSARLVLEIRFQGKASWSLLFSP